MELKWSFDNSTELPCECLAYLECACNFDESYVDKIVFYSRAFCLGAWIIFGNVL